MAISALALAFLMLSRHLQTPLPDLAMAGYLALLAVPSLWFFATRNVPSRHQGGLLSIDLAADAVLFMALLFYTGGAANPLSFYLLLPITLAALSISLWQALGLWLFAIVALASGRPQSHHALPGSAVDAMTHQVDSTHVIGMWLIFAITGLALVIMGQLLQRQWRDQLSRQAAATSIALQRERMYDAAARQADLAHEISTPLNSLQWLLQDLQVDSAACETPRPHELARASQLVDSMIDTLRAQKQDSPAADESTFARLAQQTRQRLSLLYPAVQVTLDGDSALAAPGAADCWQRIFFNLAYNAGDAGATEILLRWQNNAASTVLSCTDNGPAQQQPALAGTHLGIGLALVETSITALGGTLDIVQDGRVTQAIASVPKNARKD